MYNTPPSRNDLISSFAGSQLASPGSSARGSLQKKSRVLFCYFGLTNFAIRSSSLPNTMISGA
eukprot:1595444-Amphidinium_carterae.1